ncbi:MAG: DUF503 domain-containing protein [Myxococcota bacterium]
MSGDIYIGVLKATLMVPGSRSLKDRRQAVRSVRERIRSRFSVSVHELPGEHPGRQDLICTSAGNDGAVLRRAMDEIRHFLELDPRSYPSGVDVDVFAWHPEGAWMHDLEESDDG